MDASMVGIVGIMGRGAGRVPPHGGAMVMGRGMGMPQGPGPGGTVLARLGMPSDGMGIPAGGICMAPGRGSPPPGSCPMGMHGRAGGNIILPKA